MSENYVDKQTDPLGTLKRPSLALIIGLIILVSFDQITWQRQFGLQFFLLVLLILVGLVVLVIFEKRSVPWRSYVLLVPILMGAGMTIAFRAGITTFFNILLTFSALILLAQTLLNGQWMVYRLREVLQGLLSLVLSTLIGPVQALIQHKKSTAHLSPQEGNPRWLKIRPYLVGLLIAIPLLLIFGALLASADLIFKERLSDLFSGLKIENFQEFLFRTAYILILAYILAGAYFHALTRSAEVKTISPDKPILPAFLGQVEAFTVLVLINLLFLAFIVIQFRYFFTGEANITLEGFTYAEYARRGFFELVAVTLISLGLYYLLSMFTKRSGRTIKTIFSALGILLMVQVGLMLISAFQRLSLYETAYGFTTLRTITHVFMIWLGVLLAAATLMEVFNQFRRLSLVLFLVFFGFTLTLNLLSVDQFIARRNIAHASAGNPLDAYYLLRNLSEDGLPALFEGQQAQDTPQDVKDSLTAVLACRLAIREKNEPEPYWAGWNLSSAKADALFEQHRESLAAYPLALHSETFTYEQDGQTIEETYQFYIIEVDGEEIWCMNAD
ncbi:MAG: DUF4153 domain-containing protein [Brevefilum sp.]